MITASAAFGGLTRFPAGGTVHELHTKRGSREVATINRLPSGSWRVQIRLAGAKPSSKTFKTHAEAKAYARQQEAKPLTDLADGGRPITLAALIDAYLGVLAKCIPSKRTTLLTLKKNIGHLRLAEITPDKVIDYIKLRRSGEALQPAANGRKCRWTKPAGASTVMQDLAYLSGALRHGAALMNSRDALFARQSVSVAATTLRHARLASESEQRDRRPTLEELAAIRDRIAARTQFKIPTWDLIRFAICTALREGEICSLRWEDYNPVERTILVRNRKDPSTIAGRDDVIALLRGPVTLFGELVDPVEIMLAQPTAEARRGRIFPFAASAVSQSFRQIRASLGIKDLRFHDLRHEGISRLFEYGFDIPEVALVSGHKDWKNLKRYTHLRPQALHAKTVQHDSI